MAKAEELDDATARLILREMIDFETQIENTERVLLQIRQAFRTKMAEQRKLRDAIQIRRRELLDRAKGVPYTPALQLDGNALS